jgi:hypothetical protein
MMVVVVWKQLAEPRVALLGALALARKRLFRLPEVANCELEGFGAGRSQQTNRIGRYRFRLAPAGRKLHARAVHRFIFGNIETIECLGLL